MDFNMMRHTRFVSITGAPRTVFRVYGVAVLMVSAFMTWLGSAAESSIKEPLPGDIRRTPTVVAIEKAMPSVVNIGTEELVPIRDPFESLLREFFDPYNREAPRGRRVNQNLGSGVIVDEDGFILTNAHVTRRASRIWVKLQDGRERECEKVVSNFRSDVALLKIIPEGDEKFTPMPFAENDDLLLGETVIALGNPFGLGGSVSQGILSSKNRRPPIDEEQLDIADWLQTDAAINPGNSGGPLINLRGELIGLNVAIMRSGQGIGFAIPVRQVSRALSEALTPEGVRNMWFGARVSAGLLPLKVTEVEPESPADLAGLKQGDEILEVKGKAPRSFIQFNAMLMRGDDTQKAEFKIRRNGQEMELTVHLIPEEAYFNAALIRRLTGLKLEPQTPQHARAMDDRAYKPDQPQYLVTEVRRGSPADEAQISPGEVLWAVDGALAPDMVAVARAIHSRKGDKVTLTLRYRQRRGFMIRYGNYDVELPIK